MKHENNAFSNSFRIPLWIFLSIALVILPMVSACAARVGESRSGPANSSAAPGAEEQKKQSADKGDFKVVFRPVKNREYAALQKELMEAKLLEAVAADLNQTLALPFDITITFTECGEANAFYDPNERQISMCYELMENFVEVFSKRSQNEDEVAEAVINATVFVLYHEIGHALVHALDLPITGKEEDAVDQLSTLILADGTDEGEAAALDGAASFLSDEESVDDLPFWDEHSLGEQRFFNIVCWVYGQNPSKYAPIVNQALPEERAVRCEDEYRKIEKSWLTLLAPHMKEQKK